MHLKLWFENVNNNYNYQNFSDFINKGKNGDDHINLGCELKKKNVKNLVKM